MILLDGYLELSCCVQTRTSSTIEPECLGQGISCIKASRTRPLNASSLHQSDQHSNLDCQQHIVTRHFVQVILGLAATATVSPLDIRIHDNANCGRGSWYVTSGHKFQ